MAHQPGDAEAPLLAKPAAKRNKYPFFCAVLASMTSVLTGYSTDPACYFARLPIFPYVCLRVRMLNTRAPCGMACPAADVAVMSGAQIFMAEDLGISDAQVEVLSGVINIYSLAGALLAGWTSDRLGRRLTIVLANVFFLAGPLATALGGGYAALMVGRFIAGLGSGYALVVAPVYAAEIAPASSRGLLTSLPEV